MLPPGDAAQQARALVDDLGGTEVDGVHGYFAHQPTEVASSPPATLGVGFSFSVHALDARKVPPAELARRARAAAGVVACNTDVAQHVAVPGARVSSSPTGSTSPVSARGPARRATAGSGSWRSAGSSRRRASRRCWTRSPGCEVPAVLRIVGTGVGQASLEESIERHGLGDTVELVGRRSHLELPDEYAWADVVAVPSVVDRNGDRDGLPNVALEAMACRRPLVVSDVSALGDHRARRRQRPRRAPGDPRRLPTR